MVLVRTAPYWYIRTASSDILSYPSLRIFSLQSDCHTSARPDFYPFHRAKSWSR